jgi:sugar phosphate isomerase/epimerase
MITRRAFLASASLPALSALPQGKKIPVGLELYSVRNELKQDLFGTVRAVAKLGYEGVEFYAPYFEWTPAYAKEVRRLLDDLGIRCFSTHNSARSFTPENLPHAIELNRTLGSRSIVMASAGKVESIDGWKKVADTLNQASAKLKSEGLRAGFHNHQVEFRPIEGQLPMEVLARNTDKSVILQLDVGTCLHAGADPVAWIEKNPGRIASMHCKDWSSDPDKGYRVLFGEGIAPWKKIFEAAEKVGGIEEYLVEQEGSAHPPMETVKLCLENLRKIRS